MSNTDAASLGEQIKALPFNGRREERDALIDRLVALAKPESTTPAAPTETLLRVLRRFGDLQFEAGQSQDRSSEQYEKLARQIDDARAEVFILADAPQALLVAVDSVLNAAPCECPHHKRYDLGEHHTWCHLFDLNLSRLKTLATPAAVQAEVARDVGSLEYQGNTVSYIYDRSKAYGDEIMRTWHVIKDAGLHPGRTEERLSDCVKRLLTTPPAAAQLPVEQSDASWLLDFALWCKRRPDLRKAAREMLLDALPPQDVQAALQELKRALSAIKVVAGHDGKDCILRLSVIDVVNQRLAALPPAVETAAQPPAQADMPAICAALGFDPTNHHNAAKCPYCRPALPVQAPVQRLTDEQIMKLARENTLLNGSHEFCNYKDFARAIEAALAVPQQVEQAVRLTDEWIDSVCAPGRAKRWHGDGRQYDRDTVRLVVNALATPAQAAQGGGL